MKTCQIYIDRFCNSSVMGSFGRLQVVSDVKTIFSCWTVERPYLNNEPFVSAFPCGVYNLVRHSSQKYGETFAIVGGSVAHWETELDQAKGITRFACLFHPANIFQNVQGCVGTGSGLGSLDGLWCVTNSRKTHEALLEILNRFDSWELIVSDRAA